MTGVYYVVFVINLLLGMMLPILPLIVVGISGTVSTSGIVMGVFMTSLFAIRLMLLYSHPSVLTLMRLALASLFFGSVILAFVPDALWAYFVTAILWGAGIGIEAPAMINIMGKILRNATRGVRDHNILFAVGSCIGPVVGYFLYRTVPAGELFGYMTLLSSTSLLVGWLTIRKDKIAHDSRSDSYRINALFGNKKLMGQMLVYLAICMTYGCIVAYLPVWLESSHLRVDVFFIIFWIAFTFVQFITLKFIRDRSEKKITTSLLTGASVSVFALGFATSYPLMMVCALVFGAVYGASMFYFYRQAVHLEDDYLRKNAIAIFGIIAYVGIGAGAILFAPIAELSVEWPFFLAPVITLGFMLKNLVFD